MYKSFSKLQIKNVKRTEKHAFYKERTTSLYPYLCIKKFSIVIFCKYLNKKVLSNSNKKIKNRFK